VRTRDTGGEVCRTCVGYGRAGGWCLGAVSEIQRNAWRRRPFQRGPPV
jgi:hypothetical protein